MRTVIHGQQTEAVKHVAAFVELDDVKLARLPLAVAGGAGQSIVANAAVLDTVSRKHIHHGG